VVNIELQNLNISVVVSGGDGGAEVGDIGVGRAISAAVGDIGRGRSDYIVRAVGLGMAIGVGRGAGVDSVASVGRGAGVSRGAAVASVGRGAAVASVGRGAGVGSVGRGAGVGRGLTSGRRVGTQTINCTAVTSQPPRDASLGARPRCIRCGHTNVVCHDCESAGPHYHLRPAPAERRKN
jgi:hypothetical protein